MQKINTLDLDNYTKEQLANLEKKIKQCPNCLNIMHKDSNSKGYHVTIICNKDCDNCRFVFDDQKRYEIDFGRDTKFQNTLFDEKEYFRGNMKKLKKRKIHNCESCKKKGIENQEMRMIEIDLETVRQKMIYGKIKAPPIFVFLEYVYLECPICRWFKFVKRKEYENEN